MMPHDRDVWSNQRSQSFIVVELTPSKINYDMAFPNENRGLWRGLWRCDKLPHYLNPILLTFELIMPDLDELKKLLSTGQLSWETVVTEHPHLRPEDKLQLLRINLHSNRQGGTQPIEEYLATIPELAQHPEILFELLAAEIHHKRKAGYEPTFDEYLARFPTLAGQLPAIFDRLRSNDVSLATVRIDHSEGRVLQNRYKLVEVLASHVGTGCGRLHPPEDEGARL